jgi:hypothetical protein
MTTPTSSHDRERVQADWINVPPVFIVGCSRSGTTLMRLMLTAHPNISISSEGAHIYLIAKNFSSYAHLSDTACSMRTLHEDLQGWLEKVKFLNITFYGTWEARNLRKERLIWWGDNAPYHVHHIPFLDSLFPCSRFLLMIRDPRDTCASGKRNFPWKDFESRITQWERSLLNGLVAGMTLGPERVKCVRYEELVAAPGEVLGDISNFLGVEYTDEMLTYYQSPAAAAIADLDHHKNVVRPVFATSVGKYRQVLTTEEIERVEERLYTPMFQLRYLSYKEYRLALEKNTRVERDAE